MNCCFCALSGASGGRSDVWDTIIDRSADSLVMPSKGALVPGWLMVVPLEHALCVGALEPARREAVWALAYRVSERVAATFGSATVFEHAPAAGGSGTGCGIDHVHLHVAPLAFSLLDAARELDPDLAWHEIGLDDLGAAFRAGADHLVLREPGGPLRLARPPRPSSQFFRRAIARRVALRHEWNYRDYPREQTVVETIDRLRRSAA